MAFQSGTASSYADLQSTIETFLTGTPGYTLTSGILTKSGTLLHLEFNSTTDDIRLKLGKSSSGGSLLYPPPTIGGVAQFVGMGDAYYDVAVSPVFPVNYYLFYFSSPVETFRCVIEYNNGYTQNIGFGEIVKAGAAYGGVYIDASSCADLNGEVASGIATLSWQESSVTGANFANPLPFAAARSSIGVSGKPGSTLLYLEMAGFDWWEIAKNTPSSADYNGYKFERAEGVWVSPNASLEASAFSQPEAENCLQTHNANNVLVPIRLFGRLANDNYMRLGDINDIRWTNIKHRNFAEIMDDGTDKWMCFPAFFKDASQVNGTSTHSGQIGYAVRYDGP